MCPPRLLQAAALTLTQSRHCGFYQHASVSLHYSSDFNPLTHNGVYCDMIAQQYIEENSMNAGLSGHTQIQMMPRPPSSPTHTSHSPLTSPRSIQMLHSTVKICAMNEGASKDSSTEAQLWLTWMDDWCCESEIHTHSLVHPSGRMWVSGNLLHSLVLDVQSYVCVFGKTVISCFILHSAVNFKHMINSSGFPPGCFEGELIFCSK